MWGNTAVELSLKECSSLLAPSSDIGSHLLLNRRKRGWQSLSCPGKTYLYSSILQRELADFGVHFKTSEMYTVLQWQFELSVLSTWQSDKVACHSLDFVSRQIAKTSTRKFPGDFDRTEKKSLLSKRRLYEQKTLWRSVLKLDNSCLGCRCVTEFVLFFSGENQYIGNLISPWWNLGISACLRFLVFVFSNWCWIESIFRVGTGPDVDGGKTSGVRVRSVPVACGSRAPDHLSVYALGKLCKAQEVVCRWAHAHRFRGWYS